LVATMLSIETILSASETDSVPSANDLRPVKGYVSGPPFFFCFCSLQNCKERGNLSSRVYRACTYRTLACATGRASLPHLQNLVSVFSGMRRPERKSFFVVVASRFRFLLRLEKLACRAVRVCQKVVVGWSFLIVIHLKHSALRNQ
jgi:hypothetical protein